MTGQLDQALQRVIAQLQMTRPTNQPKGLGHKTSENRVFHPKLSAEASTDQPTHHQHPKMQVHSKPSSGRRQTRSKSNLTALSPLPLVDTKQHSTTAVTPDRRNINKENKKTNQKTTEEPTTDIHTEKTTVTTHYTNEKNTKNNTNNNNDKTMEKNNTNNNQDGNEQNTDGHTEEETQPTTKNQTNHDDTTTTVNNEPGSNSEAGTPTAKNPYLQPKTGTKRPPSPEPKTLIHLHVAVNHHQNPQIESTLPRLTEQAMKTHLNEVFFHHSKREEPMWLQVHSVDFLETKQSGSRQFRSDNQTRSTKGSGHTSTFHVTLSPAPANDVFDTEIFTEQGLRFVLQMWHKHHNDDFVYDEFDSQTVLRPGTKQSNPTINPRWDQINVYQPACNNRTSDTFGIVVGVPAQTIKHRRAALDLTGDIQNTLTPHLPRKLNYLDFFNHVGYRSGTFSGELKNKQRGQVPAIYITASSRNNFEALLRSYNAYQAANRNTELKWNHNNIQIIPMPTSQANRTATLEALKDIDQFFGACVRIKLKPINPEATDGDWKRLRHLREFVAVFPEFNNEDPDTQYYTLYLRKTPDTHLLTTNTIRQHPDFPENILLPTLAAVAATPPRQQTTNQDPTTPSSSSHTNKLLAFTNRLLRRKHNNLEDNTDETDADVPTTPTTKPKNPNSPPTNKRSASAMQPTDEEASDPYDDGTDWTPVAAQTNQNHFADQTSQNEDSKPPAKRNQFAALAEQTEDEQNNDDLMDTEESDDHSRALIGSDDNLDPGEGDNEFSATTMQEIELIFKYVAHNNPSRIEEMRQFLERTKSFTNDTDAQDAWRFAQTLVQSGNPNIADSRTSHVVPHEDRAKGLHE